MAWGAGGTQGQPTETGPHQAGRARPPPQWVDADGQTPGRDTQAHCWGGAGGHPRGPAPSFLHQECSRRPQVGLGCPRYAVSTPHHTPRAPPMGGCSCFCPPPSADVQGGSRGGPQAGPPLPRLRPERAENFLPNGPRGQQGCVGGGHFLALCPSGWGRTPQPPAPFCNPPHATLRVRGLRMQREAPTPAHPPHKTGPTPHPPPT